MDTFSCTNQCDSLCDSPNAESMLFQLSDLYPGLTLEERALAAKDPIKALRAYQQSWKAEELCLKIYSKSRTNDESDACRHFIWASLLYKELGSEFSGKVLNAHEQDPKEPEAERSMDLANNRLGLLTAEELSKKNDLNEDAILETFKDNLKKKNLIVIKPSGALP